MDTTSNIFISALKLLLKPVVRFCLRHSLKIQDLTEIGKALFNELAAEDLIRRGSKPTDSRLSIMTGLHRRDVVRLRDGASEPDKAHDVISKVIGQWQKDKRFCQRDGEAKILSFGTVKSDFSKLVQLISNDISPSSVLGELLRIGAIECGESGVCLVKDTYVPKGDSLRAFRILSEDIEDLGMAVEQNALLSASPPNMHFRTTYDRIDSDAIPKIKQWLLEKGNEVHIAARELLSQYDLDINPKVGATGEPRRVVLSSYSLVAEPEPQEYKNAKLKN